LLEIIQIQTSDIPADASTFGLGTDPNIVVVVAVVVVVVVLLLPVQLTLVKKPKAPSFQIGSG